MAFVEVLLLVYVTGQSRLLLAFLKPFTSAKQIEKSHSNFSIFHLFVLEKENCVATYITSARSIYM